MLFLKHRNHADPFPIIFFNIDINTLFLFFLDMFIEYVLEVIGVQFFDQVKVEFLSLLDWLTVLESKVACLLSSVIQYVVDALS